MVTGCNTGVGLGTCIEYAKCGCKNIIMTVRSEAKGLATMAELQKHVPKDAKTKIEFYILHTDDLRSVEKVANDINAKYDVIDILVNNVAMMCDGQFKSK